MMSMQQEALLSGFGEIPTWEGDNLAPMPDERRYFATVKLDEFRFLVVGGAYCWEEGEYILYEYPTSVHVYDSRTNSWSSLPDISQGLILPSSAFCGGKVYVLGGLNKHEKYLNTIECLDLTASPPVWRTLPQKLDLSPHCAVSVRDRFIYVFGGRELRIFDTKTGEFSQGSSVTRERGTVFAAALVGNRIYVVGGEGFDLQQRSSNTIESLKIDLESGRPVGQWTLSPSTMSVSRPYPAVTVVNHCLVVIAGSAGDSSVEIFDTRREVWWRLPPLGIDRYLAGAVTLTLGDWQVFVIGGKKMVNGRALNLDSMEKLYFRPATLVNQCELTLIRDLSTANIKRNALAAYRCQAFVLLQACIEYVRENIEHVLSDPNFVALCTEEPELWKQLVVAPCKQAMQSRKRA